MAWRVARLVEMRLEVAPTKRVMYVGSRNAETQSAQREAGSHEARSQKPIPGFLVSCSTLSLLNLSALRASAFPQFFPSVRPKCAWKSHLQSAGSAARSVLGPGPAGFVFGELGGEALGIDAGDSGGGFLGLFDGSGGFGVVAVGGQHRSPDLEVDR